MDWPDKGKVQTYWEIVVDLKEFKELHICRANDSILSHWFFFDNTHCHVDKHVSVAIKLESERFVQPLYLVQLVTSENGLRLDFEENVMIRRDWTSIEIPGVYLYLQHSLRHLCEKRFGKWHRCYHLKGCFQVQIPICSNRRGNLNEVKLNQERIIGARD